MDFVYPFLALCGFLLAFILILMTTLVLWFRYVDNKFRGCPNCGKRGVGFIIHTEVINSTSHVERKGWKRYRISDEHLIDTYRCQNCNHEWTRTLKQQTRLPLKKF